jgi:hypothetical protein
MVDELRRPRSAADRDRFYEERWNTWRWRALFRVFFSRAVMGRLGRDPEFFAHVEGAVAERILARTRYAFAALPVESNPYLAYTMTGNFQTGALPRYLRPEHREAIRARLDRVRLERAPADAIEGPFVGFNLSDIFEYMSVAEHERCYAALLDHAAPGARLVYWNMLAVRARPERARPAAEALGGSPRADQARFLPTPARDEVRSDPPVLPRGRRAGEVARAGLVVPGPRRWSPSPASGAPSASRWTRKLVHVLSGWRRISRGLSTHWSVLGSAHHPRHAGPRQRLGLLGSVTGVDRRSVGELYFPISVYLLFVVARHQPVFYLIALSVLVFSDTAAALLGVAYGRHSYTVANDRRTLEGSAAFLLVTFLCVHVPLLLGTGIGRGESLIIATQLALLVTSFEAISMRGNDNLVVPLATYYLLLN